MGLGMVIQGAGQSWREGQAGRFGQMARAGEIAGSAVQASADALENLKKQYLGMNTFGRVALPLAATAGVGAIGLGVRAMTSGGPNEEPNDYDKARVGEVIRQASNARPVHGGMRAPNPSANDAYSNLSELAKAERRVYISKKVTKEDEAIEKLKQEYDLLRGEGRALGGLYSDQ